LPIKSAHRCLLIYDRKHFFLEKLSDVWLYFGLKPLLDLHLKSARFSLFISRSSKFSVSNVILTAFHSGLALLFAEILELECQSYTMWTDAMLRQVIRIFKLFLSIALKLL